MRVPDGACMVYCVPWVVFSRSPRPCGASHQVQGAAARFREQDGPSGVRTSSRSTEKTRLKANPVPIVIPIGAGRDVPAGPIRSR